MTVRIIPYWYNSIRPTPAKNQPKYLKNPVIFLFYFLRYLKLDLINLLINRDGLKNIVAIFSFFVLLLWKKLRTLENDDVSTILVRL